MPANMTSPGKAPSGKRTKILPIAILSGIVIAGLIILAVVFLGKNKKSSGYPELDRVLDDYFDALENMNKDRIIKYQGETSPFKYNTMYTQLNNYGFFRGIIANADFLKFDEDIISC
ncbi:MAG: hypothetical protein K5697_10560, partial [Lachnospiraceae bacterium]|nr:hypothetical protein [Lachnospiraceae bacterium]